LPEREMERELQRLASHRTRQARFGRTLNTLFAPPPGLGDITTDDTVVCRCEEVCAGDVRAAVSAGVHALDALKTWTRVGQGPCQGRTCGPILARLIAASSARRMGEISPFAVRPPVKPIPLAALAAAPRPVASAATAGAAPA
jgi:bacterioferritin-associated ferredoxin